MSNVKASILIFSAQKVPKVRSDLLSYFIHMNLNVIGSFVVKRTLTKLVISQCARTDLNKRFVPKPMTTTG